MGKRSVYILFGEVDSSQEERKNIGFVLKSPGMGVVLVTPSASLRPWLWTRSKRARVDSGALA